MSTGLDKIARRFGLRLVDDAPVALRRHGITVRVDVRLDTSDVEDRHEAFCLCLGTRLGLDLRTAALPRGVGDLDWMQRLIPRGATRLGTAIAGREIRARPWLDGVPLDLVHTREAGKLLVCATADDEVDTQDGRRALFYAAYKLRPATTEQLDGGKIRMFETTAGLGSSIGSLFPDFDFDTAQDHGLFALPGYDRLVIYRPAERGADVPATLRELTKRTYTGAKLPFSRRLYSLRRDRIIPAEVCGTRSDVDAAHLAANLIDVVP